MDRDFLVVLLEQIEIAQRDSAERSDRGEVTAGQPVFPSEGQQPLHHLVARVEDDRECLRALFLEHLGFHRRVSARRRAPSCLSWRQQLLANDGPHQAAFGMLYAILSHRTVKARRRAITNRGFTAGGLPWVC